MNRSVWAILLLLMVALALRLGVAVLSPGTGDVVNFVRTARLTQEGLTVYKYHTAYPYPPLYAWTLAATLWLTDQLQIPSSFAVRLPPILADTLITLLIYTVAKQLHPKSALRLGWLYACNPITLLIASHHGQFDSLAYLPAVLAVQLQLTTQAFLLPPLLLGLGGALKIAPLFIAPAWLPDLSRRKQALFAVLAFLPVAAAFAVGYLMAPHEFVQNVLGYRRVAEGGWGYNFFVLLAERLGRFFRWEALLYLTQQVRAFHQYILIAGILATARKTRHRPFGDRLLLVGLSIQLFAGRWGHEYTAWIVPWAILSNQRGFIPWGILTLAWMMVEYVGFVTPARSLQDNLFRSATVIGFLSWIVLLVWFVANVKADDRLRGLVEPLFGGEA